MSTYAIGDVQGCYDELCRLLEKISYDQSIDQLWFVGDLINRGPDSLQTLRFIHALPNTRIVLGNHDLHLLAIVKGGVPASKTDTFDDILAAEDCTVLCDWLAQQKLFYYDETLNAAMVHAGVLPTWTLAKVLALSAEVESVLQDKQAAYFFQNMYSNQPSQWSDDLEGIDRLRFITNCLTRIRFCSIDGVLDLQSKRGIGTQISGFMPWFEVPNRRIADINLIFGHWAALEGRCYVPNTYAIDTGCVWGGALTALRLADQARFSVRSKTTKS